MRPRPRTCLAALAAMASLATPATARADGEAWQQFEYRLPIVQTARPTFPRFAWRIFTETREAGRWSGLYRSILRTGPMLWVSPWLFVAAHATLEGTHGIRGCAAPATPSCGPYVFEFRAELEPNFFGRIGPFTFNDRNRFEYRWRETVTRWRYRNQLRINLQPEQWKLLWPFVMNEWLFDLSAREPLQVFHQNRFSVGLSIQIAPTTRIDLAYMLRSRGGLDGTQTFHFVQDHIGVITLLVDVPSLPSASQRGSTAPRGDAQSVASVPPRAPANGTVPRPAP